MTCLSFVDPEGDGIWTPRISRNHAYTIIHLLDDDAAREIVNQISMEPGLLDAVMTYKEGKLNYIWCLGNSHFCITNTLRAEAMLGKTVFHKYNTAKSHFNVNT